jgi:hypothetical protein
MGWPLPHRLADRILLQERVQRQQQRVQQQRVEGQQQLLVLPAVRTG